MADNTPIEWTDATWNPITGCSVVSPGCTNCYTMKLAGTRLRNHPSRAGLTRETKAGPAWNGEVRLNEQWLDQPLRWSRPRMVFVCAHGDLFAEGVPDEWIDRVFAVMALAPQHTFQVLTKRPKRMREYLSALLSEFDQMVGWTVRFREAARKAAARLLDLDSLRATTWPLPNVWLGVSVEDQTRADERIPILLDTPAAVRWISAEPLLGPVDFRGWLPGCYECSEECGWRSGSAPAEEVCGHCGWIDTHAGEFCSRCGHQDSGHVCPRCEANVVHHHPDTSTLHWVVAGGESGRGARPMHPDWIRSLRDQCAAAGVPFLFKQHGEWIGVPDLRNLPNGSGPGFGGYHHCEYRSDFEAVRVGKKAAGRLLDGVTHDAFPVADEVPVS